MMKKPSDWDTTPAITGGYTPLPAGGYECRIVKVQLGEAKSGAEMLTIAFDIESGKYANYYRKQYEGRKASRDLMRIWRLSTCRTVSNRLRLCCQLR